MQFPPSNFLYAGDCLMNFLHQEFEAGPGDVVEVTLDGQANVLLLDGAAYSNYQTGKSYKYYGGLAKVSPMLLPVPHHGQWHVVVDLGGYSGKIKAGIRVLQGVNN